jgi:3-methyladenine DNA glycosylase AlkD
MVTRRKSPVPTTSEVLSLLKAHARPDQLAGMARFGMLGKKRLGVAVPVLRKTAKEIGKNHTLAIGLWKSGIPDARILASMIDDPAAVTPEQMDAWVKDFASWDVCDQVCMNLFDKTPHAWIKVVEWSARNEEYVKRAAFTLIACLAWHDKTAPDARFVEFLPLIKEHSTDDRNFVKKAVNWALRHIGKRNPALCKEAMRAAREIQKIESRAARWIAADALRELEKRCS